MITLIYEGDTMTKRRFRQLVVWLLTLAMVAGIPLFAAEQSTQTDSIVRANLSFDEMKYQHIEYAEVEELLNQLDEILLKEDKEAYFKWDEAYYKLYCKVNTMAEIAELHHMLSMNDKSFFDEYLYSVDLLGKIKTEYSARLKNEALSKDMADYFDLSIKRSKLVDSYYSQQTEVTIEKDGKPIGFADIVKLQDSQLDSQQIYYLYNEWYSAYNKAVGQILLELVKIDNEMAKMEGYDSYVESMYHHYSRDYTTKEAEAFIKSVKEIVPSTFTKFYQKNQLAISMLESYSAESTETLIQNIHEAFLAKFDVFQEAYNYMRQYKLYDVEYNSNKMAGGFTKYFLTYEEPFMMLNYHSDYQTVLSFIHEFGHYFSYYKIGLNEGGLDLDETYSQALELLAMDYYNEILKSDSLSKAARFYTTEDILRAVIEGCLYEEFLRAVYENPEMTVDEMNTLYSKLGEAYGLRLDGRSWCEIAHNFEAPFYYISYSVSAIAAFEIWEKSIGNEEAGINTYLKLIEAGRANGFMDSLQKAELSSPIEKETIKKIMTTIENYFSVSDGQLIGDETKDAKAA